MKEAKIEMGDIKNAYYNGGAVKWDGIDVGFVKDVDFIHNLDLESLKTSGTGGPLKLRGKKAKEITCQLKAQLFEVGNPTIMAIILGGATDPVNQGGAPVVRDDQVLPIAAYQSGAVKAILFEGGNVSSVSLKAMDNTPAVLNIDYYLDATTGVAFINPSGVLGGAETQAKSDYTYTPPASVKIPLGASFALARKSLVFEHIEEDASEMFRLTFWGAEPDGKPTFKFTDGSFVMGEITWDAIEDAVGHPTEPFGKIEYIPV